MKLVNGKFKICKVLHTVTYCICLLNTLYVYLMVWSRKSLDCLSEKAGKICMPSYHQPFFSPLELSINLLLVKPQIPSWEKWRSLQKTKPGKVNNWSPKRTEMKCRKGLQEWEDWKFKVGDWGADKGSDGLQRYIIWPSCVPTYS